MEKLLILLSDIGTLLSLLEKLHGSQLSSNICTLSNLMTLSSMENHLIFVKDSQMDAYLLSTRELLLCLSLQQLLKLWLKLEFLSQLMLRNVIKQKIMVLWISLLELKPILYPTLNGCSKNSQWVKNLSYKVENNKWCSRLKTSLVHRLWHK